MAVPIQISSSGLRSAAILRAFTYDYSPRHIILTKIILFSGIQKTRTRKVLIQSS